MPLVTTVDAPSAPDFGIRVSVKESLPVRVRTDPDSVYAGAVGCVNDWIVRSAHTLRVTRTEGGSYVKSDE
jgi:hypothetical protein